MLKESPKFIIVLCFLLIISVSLTGCTKKIYHHADYAILNDSESLVNKSDIIVYGKVIDIQAPKKINLNLEKSSPSLDIVYTVCEVKVTEVIKGDLKVGDTIKIKQAGGTFENVKHIYDDVTYFGKNKEYVFFLADYSKQDAAMPYSIINPIQAYFEIADNKIKVNAKNKLFTDNEDKDKIINSIKEKVKNKE
jgi:hypothetical protein